MLNGLDIILNTSLGVNADMLGKAGPEAFWARDASGVGNVVILLSERKIGVIGEFMG